MTGFHKRKVERQKKAEEFHKEQARLGKIEERKKLKLQKEEELLAQMKKYDKSLKELSGIIEESEDENEDKDEVKDSSVQVEEETGANVKENNSDLDEWEGFEEDKPKGILKKQTYSTIDDETEVTIEDISNKSIEDIAKANYVNLAKSQEVLEKSIQRAKEYAAIGSAPKKRKKKFRYLTKGERRSNNRKRRDK